MPIDGESCSVNTPVSDQSCTVNAIQSTRTNKKSSSYRNASNSVLRNIIQTDNSSTKWVGYLRIHFFLIDSYLVLICNSSNVSKNTQHFRLGHTLADVVFNEAIERSPHGANVFLT